MASNQAEGGPHPAENALLTVSDLVTQFETYRGTVEALDGVELSVGENEVVGIVGESGCGKSVTVRSILRLVKDPGKIVDGEVIYNEENVLDLPINRVREEIRGKEIAMVFQNPSNALNPVFRVGDQIAEVAREVRGMDKLEAKELAVELMEDVGIQDAENRYDDHPYEFSGGMKQRVLIAKSLACKPSLLIADEPTTALDKTTETQLLDLLDRMRDDYGLSVLIITHDLRVISRICDRVIVMYAGQTVETGPVRDIIKNPTHPYTKRLVKSIPRIDVDQERIESIEGSVLDLVDPISGCRFYARCPIAEEHCKSNKPMLERKQENQYAACWEV